MAHYPFDLGNLNIDFLAASAHKFHGPKVLVLYLFLKILILNHLLEEEGRKETCELEQKI